MSFQQGLSGLNSSSKALDVVGNNIANANTVGFKSAGVHFSDVYANSLAGSGASQVGIGSTVSGIQQTFTQGNITSTNNPLDISINGGGFFQMIQTDGSDTFTRNGQFHMDNLGYIVNDQGMFLKGAAGKIQLPATPASPLATNDPTAGSIVATLNLDSREGVPNTVPFDPTNPDAYNFSTTATVYDTLGVDHSLTFYFQRTTATGGWNVYGTLDTATSTNFQEIATSAGVPDASVVGTGGALTFSTSGVQTPLLNSVTLPSWALTTGADSPWSPGTVDFSSSTQYGTTSSVGQLTQGGYASGSLTGISVSSDGVIQGRYSNGQSRDLAQIEMATFTNPNGLLSLGNNQWAKTAESGDALTGVPGSGRLGVLQSAAIEESNVDLTAQLVDMITQQRNYQANAQTIKTQDQIMQTLVNLR